MAHMLRRAPALLLVLCVLVSATTVAAQQSTVFTYYGDVFRSDGVSPAPAGYRVVIANVTRLDTIVAEVGEPQAGKYQVTVVDLGGGNAVSMGDEIEVVLTDGAGAALAEPIVQTISLSHIAGARLRTDLVEGIPAVHVEAPGATPASPGQEVVHDFEVFNLGNFPDTYSLAVTSNHPDWLAPLPATVGPIPPGGSAIVSVHLTVPLSYPWVTVERIDLEACSQFDPSVCASDFTEAPVSVAVTSSSVEFRDGVVDVRWRLSDEAEGLPLRLYRRTLPDGSYESLPQSGIVRVGSEYWYRDDNVARGQKYEYLVEIDDGERLGFVLGIASIPTGVFRLQQNYPNPFNPTTRIRFDLDGPARVTLIVYDVSGRAVRTLLFDRPLEANSHTLEWNGVDDGGHAVVSGVYFLRLVAGGKSLTRRMVLLK